MYSTLPDLELRFGGAFLLLTADENDDGTADTDILTKAIVDADARIDALLGLVYETPFAEPVPPLIAELSSILAGENLARRVPSSATIIYRGDFRRATALIDALAAGQVLLPNTTRRTRSLSANPPMEDRTFTSQTLEAF